MGFPLSLQPSRDRNLVFSQQNFAGAALLQECSWNAIDGGTATDSEPNEIVVERDDPGESPASEHRLICERGFEFDVEEMWSERREREKIMKLKEDRVNSGVF